MAGDNIWCWFDSVRWVNQCSACPALEHTLNWSGKRCFKCYHEKFFLDARTHPKYYKSICRCARCSDMYHLKQLHVPSSPSTPFYPGRLEDCGIKCSSGVHDVSINDSLQLCSELIGDINALSLCAQLHGWTKCGSGRWRCMNCSGSAGITMVTSANPEQYNTPNFTIRILNYAIRFRSRIDLQTRQ